MRISDVKLKEEQPSTSRKNGAQILKDEVSSIKPEESSGGADDAKDRDETGADVKPEMFGFDRGLEADEIIGANNENGRINVLIQWKGNNGMEMVPSSVARFRCPDILIKLYEKNLILVASSNNDSQ
ncbi:Heterochromatin protein 1 [Orchesella cincta]|uniref:Heterochromatin protein 1 n=1 Tax=Orchesella cincta TaxID=48709 RepID=A0A1D2M9U4_ORCCI|nr:Heterochromatin protein 1 [Orchesella cincta]